MEGLERFWIPNTFGNAREVATKHRIGSLNLWVCKSNEEINVFFDECAHMGSSLESNGKHLVCPQHGWTYDFTGQNLQNHGPSLRKAKVLSTTNTFVEVLLPSKTLNQYKAELKHPLRIAIHSHATLELDYRGTTVLFDPWLEGPAYYGAWELYPKPIISAQDLSVDAIIITHPHPDHFHTPTLEKLDKSIPIYFPQFSSQIIEDGLDELGFSNQNAIYWGETFTVGKHFNSKFIRPRSMWEDSATFTWLDDNGIVFNWLNLVDAGSVLDEFALPDLDLLTSAFDQGASGYPLTWTHLSEQRKGKILEAQKKSTLRLLPNRAKQLNSAYFMPFAGHWRLGLESHRDYADKIPHTTYQELSNQFDIVAPQTKFLGLYPGDSYEFLCRNKNIKSSKIENEKKMLSTTTSDTSEIFHEEISQQVIHDFQNQMSNLMYLGESFGCENVEFKVSIKQNSYSEVFKFNSSKTLGDQIIEISVQIPKQILVLLSENKANWDHIAIGYWGVWSRNPDVYPANFMRLLQRGNSRLERKFDSVLATGFEYILNKTVGDIFESNDVNAPKLFGRLGLPCISCTRSNSETLSQAMEIHNIDMNSNSWILRELASMYSQRFPS
jgi:CMP-N-acetylneuraminate monooxygenase